MVVTPAKSLRASRVLLLALIVYSTATTTGCTACSSQAGGGQGWKEVCSEYKEDPSRVGACIDQGAMATNRMPKDCRYVHE